MKKYFKEKFLLYSAFQNVPSRLSLSTHLFSSFPQDLLFAFALKVPCSSYLKDSTQPCLQLVNFQQQWNPHLRHIPSSLRLLWICLLERPSRWDTHVLGVSTQFLWIWGTTDVSLTAGPFFC
jgi:hypothetical protein